MKTILSLVLLYVSFHNCMANMENLLCNREINILNYYYNAVSIRNFTGVVPDEVMFIDHKPGHRLNNAVYTVLEGRDIPATYNVEFKNHFMVRGRGDVFYIDYSQDEVESGRYKIKSDSDNRVMVQFFENTVFVLDLPLQIGSRDFGRLYAVNKDSIVITGRVVGVEYVKDLGDKIISFAVDRTTGNILVATKTKEGGELILLEYLKDRRCDLLDVSTCGDQWGVIGEEADMEELIEKALQKYSTKQNLVKPDENPEYSEMQKNELKAYLEELEKTLMDAKAEHDAFINDVLNGGSSLDGESESRLKRWTATNKLCVERSQISPLNMKFNSAFVRAYEHSKQIFAQIYKNDFPAINPRFSY